MKKLQNCGEGPRWGTPIQNFLKLPKQDGLWTNKKQMVHSFNSCITTRILVGRDNMSIKHSIPNCETIMANLPYKNLKLGRNIKLPNPTIGPRRLRSNIMS